MCGKKPFRVKRLKFSSDKLENTCCSTHNLSLLRKDVNLSKLEARNLYESINHNFTQFFLSILVSTRLVNEIYFSFVSVKNQHVLRTRWQFPWWWNACRSLISYGKQWVCNANPYNLKCNLIVRNLSIARLSGSDRVPAHRLVQTVSRTRGNAWCC